MVVAGPLIRADHASEDRPPPRKGLTLLEATGFENGVVLLRYEIT
jgi:hypothetical protein